MFNETSAYRCLDCSIVTCLGDRDRCDRHRQTHFAAIHCRMFHLTIKEIDRILGEVVEYFIMDDLISKGIKNLRRDVAIPVSEVQDQIWRAIDLEIR